MRAYALAAAFFLIGAAAYAALPPNDFVDNEVRLEEDHRLYGQPLNKEEAAKVVVEEYREPPVAISSPAGWVLAFAALPPPPTADAWAHWDRHKRLPVEWNKGAFEPLP